MDKSELTWDYAHNEAMMQALWPSGFVYGPFGSFPDLVFKNGLLMRGGRDYEVVQAGLRKFLIVFDVCELDEILAYWPAGKFICQGSV